MYQGLTVEEIRQHRKNYAEKYGNDLDRIFDALKKAESQSGRTAVNFGPTHLHKK